MLIVTLVKLSYYLLAVISKKKSLTTLPTINQNFSQIGGNNPVVIANQMNNSNIFIITVDYNDAQGAATQLLSQISTPFMNFSSSDSNGLTNTFTEINSALCYCKEDLKILNPSACSTRIFIFKF